MEAHETQIALPLRAHTILGVCEAIGEDFGFNPMFLRIPLAAMVVVSPIMGHRRLFRAWRWPCSRRACCSPKRERNGRSSPHAGALQARDATQRS